MVILYIVHICHCLMLEYKIYYGLSEVNLKCTVGNMDVLIIFNMRTNNVFLCNTFVVAISSKFRFSNFK